MGECGRVIQNAYSWLQGRRRHASSVRTHLHNFHVFGIIFVLKFNLTFTPKRCFRQERLFFYNEINFCRHKVSEISIFYLNIFLWTKVNQNAFNVNQIESYVYFSLMPYFEKTQCRVALFYLYLVAGNRATQDTFVKSQGTLFLHFFDTKKL